MDVSVTVSRLFLQSNIWGNYKACRLAGCSATPSKGRSLSSLLSLCCWGWGWGHSFFVWCLAGVGQLLSILLDCPFSNLLARENRLLLRLCFVCAHSYFQVAGFFNTQLKVYEAKRIYREPTTCRSLDPEISSQSASSLHFSESSYVCLIYNAQILICSY